MQPIEITDDIRQARRQDGHNTEQILLADPAFRKSLILILSVQSPKVFFFFPFLFLDRICPQRTSVIFSPLGTGVKHTRPRAIPNKMNPQSHHPALSSSNNASTTTRSPSAQKSSAYAYTSSTRQRDEPAKTVIVHSVLGSRYKWQKHGEAMAGYHTLDRHSGGSGSAELCEYFKTSYCVLGFISMLISH